MWPRGEAAKRLRWLAAESMAAWLTHPAISTRGGARVVGASPKVRDQSHGRTKRCLNEYTVWSSELREYEIIKGYESASVAEFAVITSQVRLIAEVRKLFLSSPTTRRQTANLVLFHLVTDYCRLQATSTEQHGTSIYQLATLAETTYRRS